ncbi:MAG: LCP family protein [Lachnospiraceae bacterium]|nr:LCP family protein [Lachnospiraceae bacterium]
MNANMPETDQTAPIDHSGQKDESVQKSQKSGSVHDGGGAHSGHHHSHHHHSRSHARKRRKMIAATVAVILVVCLATGGLLAQNWQHQKNLGVTVSNSEESGDSGSSENTLTGSYREVVYNGETYTYNNLVTCILYAGIDSTGPLESAAVYGNKARADSIELVVLDKYNQKLSVLAINRDTMTEIRLYSSTGNDDGLYTSHLGYAYSWGDGGEVSCENLCEAVSLLLGGIPILQYVVTNKDSMTWINDLVGGVTVTVPNSELEEQYPELTEGAVVTLDETNVTAFLQYRDTSEDFTNEGRMDRQQAYITAYIQLLQQMDLDAFEDAWASMEEMEDYLQTSVTKSQYLDLAELVLSLDFSEGDYIQLAGEDEAGDLHDEFWVDEEALQETILDLFYISD